ncbi:hypothetical protein M440DRAFT_1403966 [Trichoderma longibrachiatum ATCC 18648]|uniref:Secreted protein n=1 Tax=Trichoderma longibrachiatum ATCC 18648 TaxID=983965 RepID=A0A2T4BWS7_TRILO|nr:hypothetical protein M440DRAFT_1403966 [Trichoderma longibrachiatum ATCC 18648]
MPPPYVLPVASRLLAVSLAARRCSAPATNGGPCRRGGWKRGYHEQRYNGEPAPAQHDELRQGYTRRHSQKFSHSI